MVTLWLQTRITLTLSITKTHVTLTLSFTKTHITLMLSFTKTRYTYTVILENTSYAYAVIHESTCYAYTVIHENDNHNKIKSQVVKRCLYRHKVTRCKTSVYTSIYGMDEKFKV